ncbi:MAG: glycerate kinase [Candidatus Hodarchaeota archaeon]
MLEESINTINSYNLVKDVVRISEERLWIGYVEFDLSTIDNIYVVGAGKASLGMAQALDEILGDKIKEGVVIIKKGHQRGYKLSRIEIIEGSHPIPDESGYQGAKRILSIAQSGKEGDLFIGTITGGSSALMAHPVEPMMLEDEQEVTDLLLKCGANIYEINAVRRHISATNGGRLAQKILQSGAVLVNLMISDGIRNPAVPDKYRPRDWYGTPLCPDSTTFENALYALTKYNLWEKTPEKVRNYLKNADPSMETPKTFKGMKAHIFILANGGNLCEAAERKAKEMGLNTLILTTMLEGESREAGRVFGSIAKEVRMRGRPVSPPCAIICGGETTVTIEDIYGEGGPSQEFALGFASEITGQEGIVGLSFDTDGIDGSSDAAGGIVDGFTEIRAKAAGLDIYEHLLRHDSAYLLKKLDDAIFSEPTNTNVCDINIVIVT